MQPPRSLWATCAMGWRPRFAGEAPATSGGCRRSGIARCATSASRCHRWRDAIEASVAAVAVAHGRFTIALERAQYWPGARCWSRCCPAPHRCGNCTPTSSTPCAPAGCLPRAAELRRTLPLAYPPFTRRPAATGASVGIPPAEHRRIHLLQTAPRNHLVAIVGARHPVQDA